MYILRLESLVGPGQRTNFEAWHTQLYALASKQPGFLRSTLLNSLAYPTKYTRGTLWENREALLAFWATKELQAFAKAHPAEGIATPGAPMRAYEDVEMVRETDQYQYLGVVDVTIAQGQASAYEESRMAFLQLVRREGRGVALTGLVRLAGGGNQYMLLVGCRTQADATATVAMPAIVDFQQKHPLSDFGGTLTQEGYAIVQVAVGAQAAARQSARS